MDYLKMHNFIVNKTILEQKVSILGVKCKSKYPREDDEWVLEDNGQQLVSIKE
jgi:hypothetical protein